MWPGVSTGLFALVISTNRNHEEILQGAAALYAQPIGEKAAKSALLPANYQSEKTEACISDSLKTTMP